MLLSQGLVRSASYPQNNDRCEVVNVKGDVLTPGSDLVMGHCRGLNEENGLGDGLVTDEGYVLERRATPVANRRLGHMSR